MTTDRESQNVKRENKLRRYYPDGIDKAACERAADKLLAPPY